MHFDYAAMAMRSCFHRQLTRGYPFPADTALSTRGHGLRAYDAVQLAAALEVNRIYQPAGLSTVTLVSADRELNAAALAEGLAVDDPATHP